MDHTAQRALLADAATRSADYLDALHHRSVFPKPEDIDALEQVLQDALGDRPSDPFEVLSVLDQWGSPATVANAGGRYFGFVTGGALPATVAAHWLATAWDQNAFGFMSSPAIALFEATALRWLTDILHLPSDAEGTLVTGATMANFVGLAAARSEVLHRVGWDVERQGLFGAPEITVMVGAEVHGTVLKVLAMLGLGRDRVIRIPVDRQGRMRPDAIPENHGPTILCLQAGNVNSGAFDPAAEIISNLTHPNTWIHVDGAFGLWARATPERIGLTTGLEQADSWATDAHKWLNVPYDCGVIMVRSPHSLRRAMSISGSYLLQGERRDAIDVTPDSSRRARAIDVWAALKCLGRSGVAELVERNCQQAKWLAEQFTQAGITVLNEVVLNQVVVSFGNDTTTEHVLKAIEMQGQFWCGGTQWQGQRAMRISVSSWATTQADLEITLQAMLDARDRVGEVGRPR